MEVGDKIPVLTIPTYWTNNEKLIQCCQSYVWALAHGKTEEEAGEFVDDVTLLAIKYEAVLDWLEPAAPEIAATIQWATES
jgi:hypothetical protein